MSSIKKEVEINLSMASLWPFFAIRPPRWSAEIAEKYGFDKLEILPGYSVCREFRKLRRLTINSGKMGSLHDSWKRDRRAEIEHSLVTDTNINRWVSLRSFLLRSVFPSEAITRTTLQGLETIYQAPVIFHWPEDAPLYQQSILEIHPYIGLSPSQAINWVQENPEKRGLAIDASRRKWWKYLESQGIKKDDWKSTFRQLLPYVKEVHFQIGDGKELKQVQRQIMDSLLGQTIRLIKTERPEIPIVAEINPSLMARLGVGYLSFSKEIVEFIRKV